MYVQKQRNPKFQTTTRIHPALPPSARETSERNKRDCGVKWHVNQNNSHSALQVLTNLAEDEQLEDEDTGPGKCGLHGLGREDGDVQRQNVGFSINKKRGGRADVERRYQLISSAAWARDAAGEEVLGSARRGSARLRAVWALLALWRGLLITDAHSRLWQRETAGAACARAPVLSLRYYYGTCVSAASKTPRINLQQLYTGTHLVNWELYLYLIEYQSTFR